MSWGIKITILYVAFIGMILFMVIRTMTEKVDLVTEDYYQKELQFEQQITQDNAAKNLGANPSITIQGDQIKIAFPDTIAHQSVNGTINFYRPSDSSKDVLLPLKPNANGQQEIELSQFIKGLYQVKINWTAATQEYYYETYLTIP